MTTSENIQADQLASWIDGDRETLPNAECSVAIWVMRPDLAPNPKVTLDDILSRVTTGPFVTVDEGVEDNSEDDFVEAIFAQARQSVPTNVALSDILTRVESGPFAKKEEDSTSSVTVSPAANNNRWWNYPMVAGGLAVALVLLTLIPTQFKSTISEDSMFARSMKAEELPAEDVEVNIVSKQSKSFDGSSNLEVQRSRPKNRKSVSNTPDIDETSSGGILHSKSSRSHNNSVENSAGNEPVKSEGPPEVQKTNLVEVDGVNSLDVASDSFDITYNELDGIKNTILTNQFDGPNTLEDKGVVERYDSEDDGMVQGLKEERTNDSDESVEISVDPMMGPIDSMSTDSVAKSSVRAAKREKKNRGLLSQKKASASAEQAVELSIPLEISETSSSSDPLPSVLTLEQKLRVKNAVTLDAVLTLCDVNQPTQSLEILWRGSQGLSTFEAIALLKKSSNYDHGDLRYLKRNWLLVSSLLYQIGQSEEAMKYQQLASSLP